MPPRTNQKQLMSQSDINNQRQGDISIPMSDKLSDDSLPFKSIDGKSEPDIMSKPISKQKELQVKDLMAQQSIISEAQESAEHTLPRPISGLGTTNNTYKKGEDTSPIDQGRGTGEVKYDSNVTVPPAANQFKADNEPTEKIANLNFRPSVDSGITGNTVTTGPMKYEGGDDDNFSLQKPIYSEDPQTAAQTARAQPKQPIDGFALSFNEKERLTALQNKTPRMNPQLSQGLNPSRSEPQLAPKNNLASQNPGNGMSAAQIKMLMGQNMEKQYKVVKKKPKKLNFLEQNKQYLKGRPKNSNFGLIEVKAPPIRSPQATLQSPLLSPRASMSSNPIKKKTATVRKVPRENELDRLLREAQESERMRKEEELERQRLIDREKANIAHQKLKRKERELKNFERDLREKQMQEAQREELQRLEREAIERQRMEAEFQLQQQKLNLQRQSYDEQDRMKNEEFERFKKKELERIKREELALLKQEELERIRQAEIDYMERKRREDSDRQRRELIRSQELQELERRKLEELERLKLAEMEKIKMAELERRKKEELDRLKREQNDRLQRVALEEQRRDLENLKKQAEIDALRKKQEELKLKEQMELQKRELEELKKNKKNLSADVIQAQVEKLWVLYDADKSGKLDKKEVMKFMNEVLTTVKQPNATKVQFSEFYKKFDQDGDGLLDKKEMTKFIKEFIKNPPAKIDHLQEKADALQREKTLSNQRKTEELLRQKGVLLREQEAKDKLQIGQQELLDKIKQDEIDRKKKELQDQQMKDEFEKRKIELEEREAALNLEMIKIEEAKKKNQQVTPRVYVAASKQPSFVSETVCSIPEEHDPVISRNSVVNDVQLKEIMSPQQFLHDQLQGFDNVRNSVPYNPKQHFLSCKRPRQGEEQDSVERYAYETQQPQQNWGNTPKPRSRSRQKSEISYIEPLQGRAIKPEYSPQRVQPLDPYFEARQKVKMDNLMQKMADYVQKTNFEQQKKQIEIDLLRTENVKLRSQNERLKNNMDNFYPPKKEISRIENKKEISYIEPIMPIQTMRESKTNQSQGNILNILSRPEKYEYKALKGQTKQGNNSFRANTNSPPRYQYNSEQRFEPVQPPVKVRYNPKINTQKKMAQQQSRAWQPPQNSIQKAQQNIRNGNYY